jgi:site-specific DNA-methyltransferase (adenine-specific)
MSPPEPYWKDDDTGCALYLGDCREVIPALALQADCIVTDPPYAETSLSWDRWPDGWPALAATVASSMWCFGSMRMFLDRAPEFTDWKLSQDVVWQKNAGTGFVADRFKRIHEHALHWYRGDWRGVHHEAVRVRRTGREVAHAVNSGVTRGEHLGDIKPKVWADDGTRLAPSVLQAKNLRGRALHPTEKPIGILDPLIRYACPDGGLVVDPFAGSGSTLDAARQSGRRAIGIEANEEYAERAARRLSALTLPAV